MREILTQNLRPTVSEYAAFTDLVVRGGLTYITESKRLSKKGIPWYPLGSFFLPIFTRLTGKSLPEDMLPFVTYLTDYVAQADKLIDGGGEFPSWKEYQSSTWENRTKIVNTIAGLRRDTIEKRMAIDQFLVLTEKAYLGFQQKQNWKKDPSFEEAYRYRLDTSGTMWEAVGNGWNLAIDVPNEKREALQNSVVRVGMVTQYLDDLTDIREDTSMDGNLMHAVLNENPKEKKRMEEALRDADNRSRIIALLNQYAPNSRDFYLRKLDEEIKPIGLVSPYTEKLAKGVVKILLPRIVVSDGYFYKRLQF